MGAVVGRWPGALGVKGSAGALSGGAGAGADLPALAGAAWGVGPGPPRSPFPSSRGCWVALGEERQFVSRGWCLFQAGSKGLSRSATACLGPACRRSRCRTVQTYCRAGTRRRVSWAEAASLWPQGLPSCLVTSRCSLSQEVLPWVPGHKPHSHTRVGGPAYLGSGLRVGEWGTGETGLMSVPLLSPLQIFGDYYHFRHSGVVKRSLSPHQPSHSRLSREPQVRAAGGPCLLSAGSWHWSWVLDAGV